MEYSNFEITMGFLIAIALAALVVRLWILSVRHNKLKLEGFLLMIAYALLALFTMRVLHVSTGIVVLGQVLGLAGGLAFGVVPLSLGELGARE